MYFFDVGLEEGIVTTHFEGEGGATQTMRIILEGVVDTGLLMAVGADGKMIHLGKGFRPLFGRPRAAERDSVSHGSDGVCGVSC